MESELELESIFSGRSRNRSRFKFADSSSLPVTKCDRSEAGVSDIFGVLLTAFVCV